MINFYTSVRELKRKPGRGSINNEKVDNLNFYQLCTSFD